MVVVAAAAVVATVVVVIVTVVGVVVDTRSKLGRTSQRLKNASGEFTITKCSRFSFLFVSFFAKWQCHQGAVFNDLIVAT